MKIIGKIVLLTTTMLVFGINFTFGQGIPGVPGIDCNNASPFCSDNSQYSFPSGVNSGNFGSSIGCLGSAPNPAWYVMQVGQSGRINIHLKTVPQEDIDFACWGPFTSATSECGQLLTNCNGCLSHSSINGPNPSDFGGYPFGNLIDCSFSDLEEEYVHIPNAISGEWYVLLVTNYSNHQCQINMVSDSTSTGLTNCDIMTPHAIGDTVCVEETAILSVSSPVSGASYTWEGPNNFRTTTTNSSILFEDATPTIAGQYSLTITNNGNSRSPTFCSLVVNSKPTSGFLPSAYKAIIDEGNITFNDMSSNATSWHYNFGESHNPSNTSTEQSPTHTYISTGFFDVWQVVTTDFGCTDSSYKRIHIEAPYFFYLPSAFTPNNDGENEMFCPEGKGIDSRNYTMEIYDRYGILIFKTNNPFACWDGLFNGEKAPLGSYIYKISLKDMESNYHEYMGPFVILE